MLDKRVFLKVKVKSLAEEAKIIRREEKKNPALRRQLADHRRGTVRREARHSQLAYCFLRGRRYRQIEPKAKVAPYWKKIGAMIYKYGIVHSDDLSNMEYCQARGEMMSKFKDWKDEPE